MKKLTNLTEYILNSHSATKNHGAAENTGAADDTPDHASDDGHDGGVAVNNISAPAVLPQADNKPVQPVQPPQTLKLQKQLGFNQKGYRHKMSRPEIDHLMAVWLKGCRSPTNRRVTAGGDEISVRSDEIPETFTEDYLNFLIENDVPMTGEERDAKLRHEKTLAQRKASAAQLLVKSEPATAEQQESQFDAPNANPEDANDARLPVELPENASHYQPVATAHVEEAKAPATASFHNSPVDDASIRAGQWVNSNASNMAPRAQLEEMPSDITGIVSYAGKIYHVAPEEVQTMYRNVTSNVQNVQPMNQPFGVAMMNHGLPFGIQPLTDIRHEATTGWPMMYQHQFFPQARTPSVSSTLPSQVPPGSMMVNASNDTMHQYRPFPQAPTHNISSTLPSQVQVGPTLSKASTDTMHQHQPFPQIAPQHSSSSRPSQVPSVSAMLKTSTDMSLQAMPGHGSNPNAELILRGSPPPTVYVEYDPDPHKISKAFVENLSLQVDFLEESIKELDRSWALNFNPSNYDLNMYSEQRRFLVSKKANIRREWKSAEQEYANNKNAHAYQPQRLMLGERKALSPEAPPFVPITHQVTNQASGNLPSFVPLAHQVTNQASGNLPPFVPITHQVTNQASGKLTDTLKIAGPKVAASQERLSSAHRRHETQSSLGDNVVKPHAEAGGIYEMLARHQRSESLINELVQLPRDEQIKPISVYRKDPLVEAMKPMSAYRKDLQIESTKPISVYRKDLRVEADIRAATNMQSHDLNSYAQRKARQNAEHLMSRPRKAAIQQYLPDMNRRLEMSGGENRMFTPIGFVPSGRPTDFALIDATNHLSPARAVHHMAKQRSSKLSLNQVHAMIDRRVQDRLANEDIQAYIDKITDDNMEEVARQHAGDEVAELKKQLAAKDKLLTEQAEVIRKTLPRVQRSPLLPKYGQSGYSYSSAQPTVGLQPVSVSSFPSNDPFRDGADIAASRYHEDAFKSRSMQPTPTIGGRLGQITTPPQKLRVDAMAQRSLSRVPSRYHVGWDESSLFEYPTHSRVSGHPTRPQLSEEIFLPLRDAEREAAAAIGNYRPSQRGGRSGW
jgi:hypothetical protein